MKQHDLFIYLRNVRDQYQPDQAAIKAVRMELMPAGTPARNPKIQLALIEKLAILARSGQKNPQARALLHLLESECGLSRPVIFDSIMNEKASTTA